jgi:hypothetical protein
MLFALIAALAAPGRGLARGGAEKRANALAGVGESHAKAGRADDAASLFEAAGRVSEEEGNLDLALSFGLRARALRRTMLRPVDAAGVALEVWLAGVLASLSKHAEAAEAAGRAWTAMVQRLGSDHADTLHCHELLARARLQQGYLSIATTHYRALQRAAVRAARTSDATRFSAILASLSRARS